MKTVAVTGASGHIGGNLVKALLDQGRSVRALLHGGKGLLGDDDVEWIEGDVQDKGSLRRAFEGADVLYHLAAVISIDGEQGGLVPSVNVQGAGNVAEAAGECGVKRMIHFSSVHGFNQVPKDRPLDETRDRATGAHHNAYDRSKAGGEAQVRKAMEGGLECVIVHPTGVIGPLDDRPSRMGQVFLDLYHRRMPALVAGGFDWVDVRDVVAGAMAAEVEGRNGENYLLSGSYRTVKEMAELAQSVTGKKPPAFTSPMWLARFGAPFQSTFDKMRGRRPLFTGESLEALRANKVISHEKAVKELGYAPRPIEESVKDIYAWFEAHGMLEEGP